MKVIGMLLCNETTMLHQMFTLFQLYLDVERSPPCVFSYCCTFLQVKVLFLILVDLCRRTAGLQHPLPASQVGANNIIIRLHYIDGNYTVLPEVVEASLGPHMQVCHIYGYKVQFFSVASEKTVHIYVSVVYWW